MKKSELEFINKILDIVETADVDFINKYKKDTIKRINKELENMKLRDLIELEKMFEQFIKWKNGELDADFAEYTKMVEEYEARRK